MVLPDLPAEPTVVVGVDGSDTAQHALSWAVDHAARVDMPVLAVCAWTRTPVPVDPYLTGGFVPPEAEETTANRTAWLAVEPFLGRHVRVAATTVQGPAVRVLTELARPQDLLVVGARGHGALMGVVLGSVAHGCVAKAHCPVVVVPDASRQQAGAAAGTAARH